MATQFEAPTLVKQLRGAFDDGLTQDISARRKTLRALAYMLEDNRSAIAAAYAQDLGWEPEEVYLLELDRCLDEVLYLESSLLSLTKPERVSGGLVYPFSSPHILREPLGVVTIFAAWNFPLQLALMPLFGAIAAGNTVVLKLSELSPTINTLLATLLGTVLDSRLYRVITGGADVAQALSRAKADFVLFTGNEAIGRKVYQAAAAHLTPVALELGGSCPAVVDGTFPLDLAAKRIAWAKFTNAGQTCVAVNHVIVLEQYYEAFVKALQAHMEVMFSSPGSSKKVINDRHFARLQSLAASTSGKLSRPGSFQDDRTQRIMAPALVTDLKADDPVLHDEIFGPILPVLAVDSIEEAVQFTRKRGAPLALYVFSNDQKTKEHLKHRVQSGALVHNDALLQMGLLDLPFGGVGSSGFGRYHGRRTFELFTYERSVMTSPAWYEPLLAMRYPPLAGIKSVMIALVMRKKIGFPRPGQRSSYISWLRDSWPVASLVALVALLTHPSARAWLLNMFRRQ